MAISVPGTGTIVGDKLVIWMGGEESVDFFQQARINVANVPSFALTPVTAVGIVVTIPTLPQWGFFALFSLLLVTSAIYLYRRRCAMTKS